MKVSSSSNNECSTEDHKQLYDNLDGVKVWKCGEYVKKEISKQSDSFNISHFYFFLQNYKDLSHPNLIQITDVSDTESTISILSNYIKDRCDPFTDPSEALKFLKNCTSALLYLQSYGIAHNDIKIENILKSSSGEYIIIDLDYISTYINECSNNEKSVFLVGTKGYYSPEKLNFQSKLNSGVNMYEFAFNAYKSDIFSLGISFLRLIINEFPIEYTEIEEKIENLPQEYRHFSSILRKMLDFDEEKRLDSIGLNEFIIKEFPLIDSFIDAYCRFCKETVPLFDLFVIENKIILCRRCLTEKNKIDFELGCQDCEEFSLKEYRCRCCIYCLICKSSEHSGICALGISRKLGFIKCLHIDCDSHLIPGLSYFKKCSNGHYTCVVCRGSMRTDHKFCAFIYSF